MSLHSVIRPGRRIRSYDFSPNSSYLSYLEGIITSYDDKDPSNPFYNVHCDYCNYLGRAGMNVRVASFVETNDFSGRLLELNGNRPLINMTVSEPQYLECFNQVWILRRTLDSWEFFNRDNPDKLFWKLPDLKSEEILWDAISEKMALSFS